MVEALVEGFVGGVGGIWWRDLVEANGGGVGERIWWRDLVEGNGGRVGGGIWWRGLVEGNAV